MSREREEVIPVVKEELDVGKRATERRYRVKSYVIERPVEKKVTVRDERVEIEHRPISRTGDLRMPEEREIEVVERHEEPFAEKRVTANEEIVVRKEVVERPETVRGTVRETKVEVEKEPAGTAARDDRTPRPTAPPAPDAARARRLLDDGSPGRERRRSRTASGTRYRRLSRVVRMTRA